MEGDYIHKLSIFMLLLALSTAEDNQDHFSWGATQAYKRGEYWGQSVLDPTTGFKKPNGLGTYVSFDGNTLYSGNWENGYMHGIGNRYFEDGRNYSGYFKHNIMHGSGRMFYPNGTVFSGIFLNGVESGNAEVTYANGDTRTGFLRDGMESWVGKAVYKEASRHGNLWNEYWKNGRYEGRVYIHKNVVDKYETIQVEIICKVHAKNARAVMSKEGVNLDIEPREPDFPGHEIQTLVATLPFSDDAFKVYTCRAVDDQDIVIDEDKLQVRNPFFFESHGECGVQFGRKYARKKRDALVYDEGVENVVMGQQTIYPGQIPWQALLSTNVTANGQEIGDFCGGTIISPWHILTAGHCIKIGQHQEIQLGRDLKPEEIEVKLGHTTRPYDILGKSYRVKRIYVHQEFDNESLTNDIALIALTHRIDISNYINPVCLPKSSFTEALIGDQKEMTVSGFGVTYNKTLGTWRQPNHLLMASSIKMMSVYSCIPGKYEKLAAFPGHFCAGSGKTFSQTRTYSADSCRGDSGGPLTFKDPLNGRFQLVGLVSWGPRMCGTEKGSTYVNVSHYLSWIRGAMLQDLVDDYRLTGNLPYDKMDSNIFQSIFEHMSSTSHCPIV